MGTADSAEERVTALAEVVLDDEGEILV